MFSQSAPFRAADTNGRTAVSSRAVAGVTALLLAIAAVPPLVSVQSAEDEPRGDDKHALAQRRLKIMQQAIDAFSVSSMEADVSAALKFAPRPLLRYNDETRGAATHTTGVLDAAVWRLGTEGRPTAVVTTELDRRRPGTALLVYEFVSLAPWSFEMKSSLGPKWIATHSELELGPLEDAPAPAESPRRRLTQMRQLARRFKVQEQIENDRIECRLLSQPLDRYADLPAGVRDGAIFVFANGTNPEIGLLLECSVDEWFYGVFRLSAAALFAQLDGHPVFEAPKIVQDPIAAPYTAKWHEVPLTE